MALCKERKKERKKELPKPNTDFGMITTLIQSYNLQLHESESEKFTVENQNNNPSPGAVTGGN